MKLFLTSLVTLFAAVLFFSAPKMVEATSLSNQINDQVKSSAEKTGVGDATKKPQTIVAGLIKVLLGLFGMMFLLIVILGGYTIFTANGDESKVDSGKKMIQMAIVGLGIVLAGYSLAFMFAKGIEMSVSEKNINKGPSGLRYDEIF